MRYCTHAAVNDNYKCNGRSIDQGILWSIKLGGRIEKKLLHLSKKENGA